jgi:hypothetical protein
MNNLRNVNDAIDATLMILLGLFIVAGAVILVVQGYRYYRDNKPMATRVKPRTDPRNWQREFERTNRP